MTEIKKIELLIGLINSTDSLNGEEFNKNKDALDLYKIIYGDDQLKMTLDSKDDLHLNKFYYPDWILKDIIEKNDVALREVNGFFDKVENKYTKNWLKVFLIQRAVDLSELDLAEIIIEELPDEDDGPARYVGHRIILKYYAKSCNIEGFIKRLKLSKPSRFPRNQIGEIKYLLIENYSRKNGFEKALELCNDKNFGHQFSIASIRWTAHLMGLDEIDSILVDYPIIRTSAPNAKADLYVKHFSNQKPFSINDSDFSRAFSEVLKLDKNIKFGDMRLRDYLLMDLGSSTLNATQIKECKKQIISPLTKKELTYHLENIKNDK
jgi:hypothetical protein